MPATEHAESGPPGSDGLFAAYELDGFFDEVFDSEGRVRPHYAPLLARLTGFTPDDLLRRARLPRAAFRRPRRCLPEPGHHLHGLRRGRGHRAHLPDGPAPPDPSRRRVGPHRGRARAT